MSLILNHVIQHSLDDECLIRSYDSKQKITALSYSWQREP